MIGMSAGRWRLRLALRETTGAELARIVGVSRQTLNRWCNGERVPEYRGREALRVAIGIPLAAWDEPHREDAA